MKMQKCMNYSMKINHYVIYTLSSKIQSRTISVFLQDPLFVPKDLEQLIGFSLKG